jgi:hypothetical protein
MDAITIALAARYAAAQVTPPTGYDNVKLSTADLPPEMTPLPTVLVYPDHGDFTDVERNGTRFGSHAFMVRFYYNQIGDIERDMKALRQWLTVLVDQLKAAAQLGGTASVVVARVETWQIGTLHYAGADYSGVELRVGIQTAEGWGATA